MTRTTMPPKELESPPMQSAPCPGRLVEGDLGILGARKAERHQEDPDRRHLTRLRVGKRRPLPEVDLGRLPGTEVPHDRGRFALGLSSLGLPKIAQLSIASPGFRGSAPGPNGWPAPRSCPDATQESGLTKGGRSTPLPAGSRALQTPPPDRCRPARTFPLSRSPFASASFRILERFSRPRSPDWAISRPAAPNRICTNTRRISYISNLLLDMPSSFTLGTVIHVALRSKSCYRTQGRLTPIRKRPD